ncbi:hypothetical protein SP049_00195 [Salmonella phage FSL SP-049]|uniref:Uncharacterized protein n=3 Tax=Cornellvirus TaxID=1910993 RepID=S4TSX3_9CAUD|nr:hypothetical protein N275_gp14 [Salmonella phage FSL SP-031]AGF88960.1 hypothetical protein SP049_00195 [Salmonella phage FSL SP-049]AGF89611.1 hypothetical protein SP038_00110 [Salmonella phage FSL SP-038]EAU9554989.1 hypothetical protein [Salmonella enterica]EBH9533074.1 hypothetical protein [Salmonella enterica subsp. enterica serovar Cerro]ECX6244429.1 hypothetical protein [Salmonella enterica subsp. enterica serovar Dublin]
MLETIIKLLERFVVAHELIAANSAKQPAAVTVANNTTKPVEIKVEGEDVIDTKPAKAKSEPEDDLDDEELEEKPKQKRTRGQSIKAAAEATKPKGPDVAKLREEIKTIAKAIAAGDSDECADKFDELLEDYKVRTVTKLADEDVEAFHKDATKLVGKYYEVEE